MNKCKSVLKRAIAILLICLSVVPVFTGCTKNEVVNSSYRSLNGTLLDTQVLAENSEYELSWDKDGRTVILKSIKDDRYWSDILYDSFLEGSESANGNSPISITVANTKTLKWDTVTSYSQMDSKGNIVCKKLDNGIRVTYFFDAYKIAVPVDYTLENDKINITIDSSKILEDGTDYKLVSITVAPNLCSVKNDAENGSLFIPSGCGAIMYTAENSNGTREFVGEVYGRNASRRNPVNLTNSESIRLPVFGAYGDSSGIMGIIEDGAESCEISAKAGNSRLGYSTVGAVFYVRDYDEFSYMYYGNYNGITTRVNELISGQTLSVSYYPLYNEEADYNGIARKYRKYLIDKGELIKDGSSGSAYSVTMLGGTNITTSIFGIPNKKLIALTTFSQAENILEKLNNNIGIMPCVRMSAFSDNGVNVGSIAGGKQYSKVYGNKNDIKQLNNLCKDDNLFFDYDIVQFSKSGSGFSINFDTARTAIAYKAEHYPVSPLRVQDEKNVYYTISRKSLSEAADFAVKKAKKYEINSVCFSSLGSAAFSDTNYICKDNMDDDVSKIISNAKSNARKIGVADANVYAACAADVLFDTPIENGRWDSFDLEIPFYQMVFHSYKSMYSNAVNLTGDTNLATARVIAFGMGIGYTISNNYIDNSDDFGKYRLYGTVYGDNADNIYDVIVKKSYKDIYYDVCNSEFVSYQISKNGLSISNFSNGKSVYVNQSANAVMSPIGILQPYEFKIN